MPRWLHVIAYVLLGSATTAGGMGLFLSKANADRVRLSQVSQVAAERSAMAAKERDQAIAQANDRIAKADQEIAKAQSTVRLLEEEREMLASAQTLLSPNAKDLKKWTTITSVPLGVSLKAPPNTTVETNDAQALLLGTGVAGTAAPLPLSEEGDRRWFSVSRYDAKLESELINQLASSTQASYAIQGRLLLGQQGIFLRQNRAYAIFRVRYKGEYTHLLWIREPDLKNPKLLDVFSTLNFQ